MPITPEPIPLDTQHAFRYRSTVYMATSVERTQTYSGAMIEIEAGRYLSLGVSPSPTIFGPTPAIVLGTPILVDEEIYVVVQVKEAWQSSPARVLHVLAMDPLLAQVTRDDVAQKTFVNRRIAQTLSEGGEGESPP